jgi:hypothetical protein
MKHQKILIALFVLAFLCQSCRSQVTDWARTKHWKIYSIAGQRVFKISKDSLQNLPSSDLDGDSLRYFLSVTKTIPLDQTPVWMGSWLSSYESTNGRINKVEISTYGGFFYDEASSKYYEVPRELSAPWRIYINNRITKLKAGN